MHRIPMGSSNLDVVTTDDVEAQRHNPNWFAVHRHMLRPDQKDEVTDLGYFILKVPECTRQPSQAFSPHGFPFGLHNRENLDNSGAEALKLDIAVRYRLVGEKWDHFCDTIVDDPKTMLACYGLQDGVTSWTDKQIKHVLALDALFLATYIDMEFPKEESRLWTCDLFTSGIHINSIFFARHKAWVGIVCSDLFRVENQIPFVLIDKVVEYIRKFVACQTSEDNAPRNDDIQYRHKSIEYAIIDTISSFMANPCDVVKSDKSSLFGEQTHILGAAYNAICGSEGLLMMRMKRSIYIRIPSATKLKQSGIKIVSVLGPLCEMSYEKTCLYLPKMVIYDETISFIRNMAWYEFNTIIGNCLFSDYIFLMTDLIQAPEDLELLIKCKVIDNTCGTKGFEMWTTLKGGLAQIDSSPKHHAMKEDIESKCKLKRCRLWSEFHTIFCSRPWLVLSTIAIVLVTMATLVQTYIAIFGSNKMKPKFP